MAGAMRKFGVYLGLVEEPGADEYVEEVRDTRTVDLTNPARKSPGGGVLTAEHVGQRPAQPVHVEQEPVIDLRRITSLQPRTYNDAKRIGEEFRESIPVILSLTELAEPDARRIVDFAAGLTFGLRGSMERIAPNVFLLSPANVDVGAEVRAQFAQDVFFNQS